ncbi:MAG: hypothetical protein ACI9EB_001251 [Pseudomonas sp.]|jgi:hypothetical protein
MKIMGALLTIATLTTTVLATSVCAADAPQGGFNSAHTATLPITQTST